jgi:PAS domain S-box-containing protein/putative nucleotidyltransferase with HDIG domain
MKQHRIPIPIHLRIALIYALFGGIWILFSDRLLAFLVEDPRLLTLIQTFKGWLFVLTSAVIIYLLLRNDPLLRKQAETALEHSQERYRTLVELSPEAIVVLRNDKLDFINPAGLKLLGASTPDQILGKSLDDIFHSDYHALVRDHIRGLTNQPASRPIREGKIIRLDGQLLEVELSASPFTDSQGQAIQMILRDITERKRAAEKIERQNQHMASLSAIDMAIISTMDLRVTLNIFLERATSQLQVDAALVLLLKQPLNTLEYVAGRGFRNNGISQLKLRSGEDFAGQAASERRLVSVSNFAREGRPQTRTEQVAGEGFAAYHAVPLLVKGKVKGVLEVFNRSPFSPDQEWLDFFTALARQAAIAIDNTELFDELQRTNTNLVSAYDETIEGWSRAMDLRDHETEGHTLRVTQMAVQLAGRLGLDEKEISLVRRGSLLHDIGKMGIPDAILLKPGRLTTKEWTAMRMHPVYAYELLNPISYLQPATDIPHYHHEKWDGSGYPEGLSANTIPLSARLFALVDVWDALGSDRPYRPGWPHGRVVEYIQAESGKHFDPEIAEIFLSILKG